MLQLPRTGSLSNGLQFILRERRAPDKKPVATAFLLSAGLSRPCRLPQSAISFWKLRSFRWTVSCLSMRVGMRQPPITSGPITSPSPFKEPVVPYRHRVR